MPENAATQKKTTYKLYVEVGVVYASDGTMSPTYVCLQHGGEKLEVDKVYRHQRLASRKAGGCGICYFVRIKGQDVRLFYEDAPDACRWFVETKYPVYIPE